MAFGAFGVGGLSSEQGPYAAWATRLAAWSADPSTSLDELPSLDEHTFDRNTYNRFNAKLSEALQAFMDQWSDHFVLAFGRAQGTHELAVSLVQLRNSLKPRLVLARHPGLPQAVREALESGLAKDLANIQEQIETSVRQSSSRGSVDLGGIDLLLSVVHENSMVALLTMSVGDADVPASPPAAAAAAPPPPPTARKLFIPHP